MSNSKEISRNFKDYYKHKKEIVNLSKSYNVGDELVAISKCIMCGNEENEQTLTIGKIYNIEWIDKKHICVIDDSNDDHFFPYKDLHKFFLTKKELRRIKLNEIKNRFMLSNE